jgi:phosphoribosylamine--glycine ligase
VRVLLLGSGGREHALARALSADPDVTDLHAAPGNPGIAELAHQHPVDPTDTGQVAGLARATGADLVVVGPEAPLVAGVADALRASGIPCFGPSRRAAAIEGSKSFAKQIMQAAGIPTAESYTCETSGQVDAALAELGPPYVVKADGLAAGKGVVVTTDLAAARAHAEACGTVVIEEFLDGPEVSLFALADGFTAVPLLAAQDFKRAQDGDQGPNTGGMGAYVPLPWAPPGLAEEVLATVIQPAVDELRRRGTPYRGLLYAGLSLTAAGVRVVEFNARFGDPETQVVLDRLATPLAGLLAAAASGSLASAPPLRWAGGAAVTVVIAAEGYPGQPARGDAIEGLAEAGQVPGAYVLHAGTALDGASRSGASQSRASQSGANRDGASQNGDGQLVAAGGRVLDVVGTGPDLAAARAAAYEATGHIRLRGGWYRHDIAEQAARADQEARAAQAGQAAGATAHGAP